MSTKGTKKGSVSLDAGLALKARAHALRYSLRLNQYLAILIHNEQVHPARLREKLPITIRTNISLSMPTTLRVAGEARAAGLGFRTFGHFLDHLIAASVRDHDTKLVIWPRTPNTHCD